MSRINEVMREVRKEYKGLDWERLISERWVESYLNSLYFMKRSHELWDAWHDIWALSMFLDSTGAQSLSELPWWEYSVALEWIESHVMDGDRFDLTLDHARRMMERWINFYEHLAKMDVVIEMEPIQTAYRTICGGSKLKLVERIPFTGEEAWMTVTASTNQEDIDFQISDFWLIIMYAQLGDSWDALSDGLKGGVSVRAKRQRIEHLRTKLRAADCEKDPVQLVRGQVDAEDIEDAERWFYRKKVSNPSSEE